jgi:hypothetical protein
MPRPKKLRVGRQLENQRFLGDDSVIAGANPVRVVLIRRHNPGFAALFW